MCGGTDAGGSVELHNMQSPIRSASEYVEELWRCIRDALESTEFDTWGCTLTVGNTEKGVKQGKSSYPLLSMKKDQANKTNVERVYRQWPLVWEPGPNRSSIQPNQLTKGPNKDTKTCT